MKKNINYFFDAEWYLKKYEDVKKIRMTPLAHYIKYGWKEKRDPSKYFSTKEYLEKYPEIIPINMNPFEHICHISHAEPIPTIEFPKELKNITKEFHPLKKEKIYNRVAVVASFQVEGTLPEYLLYYLKELSKICDALILIGDNPILPSEIEKLSFVNFISFSRHGEFDFGSYKRGLEYIEKNIELSHIKELILCNDSTIGPIFSLEEMFNSMEKRNCDFWGVTSNKEITYHLQSYFLVFNHKVIISDVFKSFIKNIKKEKTKQTILLKYEMFLTTLLLSVGFSCESYMPSLSKQEQENLNVEHPNITMYPLLSLDKGCPFIKVKALINDFVHNSKLDSNDDFSSIMTKLRRMNKEVAKIVGKYVTALMKKTPKKEEKKEKVGSFEELLLRRELANYLAEEEEKRKKPFKFRESKIVHRYLNGLNGIEIGASSHNSFGLDKTGAYANVDYKSNHGDLWQQGSRLEPAKVNFVSQGDDLPFKDSVLDYVISSHAIEHFFDPIKTIKEWFRVVKKGGYVILIVPHKERTFDKNREVTTIEELLDRYSKKLAFEDYAYYVTEEEPLPSNYLIQVEGNAVPNGYKPLTLDVDSPKCHLTVWNTERFIELCTVMRWNVIEVQDVDDKVGNGFLVILKK